MQSRELQEIRKEKHQDVNMNYIAEQSKFNLTSQNNFISFKINSTSLCKQIYFTFLDLHDCRPVAEKINSVSIC